MLNGDAADRVSVLSWNVLRYNAPWYVAAPWRWRRDGVLRRLREAGADIVCLQEILHPVRDDVLDALPQHEWVGVGRNDGATEGEYAPILFDKSKFMMLDRGWFWLSDQPHRPSIGWDANQPRIVTWVRLQPASKGTPFIVVNTHFDHRGHRAREEAAWLLASETFRLSRGDPCLIAGDFNARAVDPPLRTLQLFMTNGDLDPRGHAVGPPATHAQGRIDHILYSGHFTRVEARTLPGGRLSDHAALHYTLAFDWPNYRFGRFHRTAS